MPYQFIRKTGHGKTFCIVIHQRVFQISSQPQAHLPHLLHFMHEADGTGRRYFFYKGFFVQQYIKILGPQQRMSIDGSKGNACPVIGQHD